MYLFQLKIISKKMLICTLNPLNEEIIIVNMLMHGLWDAVAVARYLLTFEDWIWRFGAL